MSEVLFDENGHLTEKAIKCLKDGSLKSEETIMILDHVSECEKCSVYLADGFDDTELVKAPSGFCDEVENKIKKRKSNEFIFYSVRVSIAACMALMIVFSNTLNFIINAKKVADIAAPNLSIVNSINTNISNFSQKIINMEGFNNENEKR
ncbi:hypothetical protein [Clostridium sp. AWRP]|uniref:hypothetical protein n=1 Tax=Clostridium sp. AWRP TaxID=2212991 RepID=UPI000FDB37D5|nr:hypothetical protein [Clostridium sp. AWRP]AZV55433.1 hypothetical protein DMR38_01760 [Clostridium sp. AWRP]